MLQQLLGEPEIREKPCDSLATQALRDVCESGTRLIEVAFDPKLSLFTKTTAIGTELGIFVATQTLRATKKGALGFGKGAFKVGKEVGKGALKLAVVAGPPIIKKGLELTEEGLDLLATPIVDVSTAVVKALVQAAVPPIVAKAKQAGKATLAALPSIAATVLPKVVKVTARTGFKLATKAITAAAPPIAKAAKATLIVPFQLVAPTKTTLLKKAADVWGPSFPQEAEKSLATVLDPQQKQSKPALTRATMWMDGFVQGHNGVMTNQAPSLLAQAGTIGKSMGLNAATETLKFGVGLIKGTGRFLGRSVGFFGPPVVRGGKDIASQLLISTVKVPASAFQTTGTLLKEWGSSLTKDGLLSLGKLFETGDEQSPASIARIQQWVSGYVSAHNEEVSQQIGQPQLAAGDAREEEELKVEAADILISRGASRLKQVFADTGAPSAFLDSMETDRAMTEDFMSRFNDISQSQGLQFQYDLAGPIGDQTATAMDDPRARGALAQLASTMSEQLVGRAQGLGDAAINGAMRVHRRELQQPPHVEQMIRANTLKLTPDQMEQFSSLFRDYTRHVEGTIAHSLDPGELESLRVGTLGPQFEDVLERGGSTLRLVRRFYVDWDDWLASLGDDQLLDMDEDIVHHSTETMLQIDAMVKREFSKGTLINDQVGDVLRKMREAMEKGQMNPDQALHTMEQIMGQFHDGGRVVDPVAQPPFGTGFNIIDEIRRSMSNKGVDRIIEIVFDEDDALVLTQKLDESFRERKLRLIQVIQQNLARTEVATIAKTITKRLGTGRVGGISTFEPKEQPVRPRKPEKTPPLEEEETRGQSVWSDLKNKVNENKTITTHKDGTKEFHPQTEEDVAQIKLAIKSGKGQLYEVDLELGRWRAISAAEMVPGGIYVWLPSVGGSLHATVTHNTAVRPVTTGGGFGAVHAVMGGTFRSARREHPPPRPPPFTGGSHGGCHGTCGSVDHQLSVRPGSGAFGPLMEKHAWKINDQVAQFPHLLGLRDKSLHQHHSTHLFVAKDIPHNPHGHTLTLGVGGSFWSSLTGADAPPPGLMDEISAGVAGFSSSTAPGGGSSVGNLQLGLVPPGIALTVAN